MRPFDYKQHSEQDKFEDSKGVIVSRSSKKVRQYNNKDKR